MKEQKKSNNNLLSRITTLETAIIGGDIKMIVEYLNMLTQIKVDVDKLKTLIYTEFIDKYGFEGLRTCRDEDTIAQVLISTSEGKPEQNAVKFRRLKILLARMYKFLDTLPEQIKVTVMNVDTE